MPEALAFKDLLDLLEKLETRVNAYWNFYTVVTVAAGGWLLTRSAPFSLSQGLLLMAGLACFYAANFAMIRGATRLIVAAGQEVRARAGSLGFASPEFQQTLRTDLLPGRLPVSYVLHLAVDAVLLLAIALRIGPA
ncbi:MAG TPA: hypothetical protein VLV76_03835 [Candidatus Acidoferrum sp.]|nr:hypothetical protein [Candidatus Acidoferrum sp.]